MCSVSLARLHQSNQARTYLACMTYSVLSHLVFGQNLPLLHSIAVCVVYQTTACSTHEVVGCRYVANETPGTKQAKLQLLEQLGWKCYSVTWAERCVLHSLYLLLHFLKLAAVTWLLPNSNQMFAVISLDCCSHGQEWLGSAF